MRHCAGLIFVYNRVYQPVLISQGKLVKHYKMAVYSVEPYSIQDVSVCTHVCTCMYGDDVCYTIYI